jgi:hypothetical protein
LEALLGGSQAETSCKFRVLSQQFALERITLLAGHRRDVSRIFPSGHILDSLRGPTVHPRDPRVRSPVSAVRII